MNAQQFLTIEWAFGLVISTAITSLWRYVNSQAEIDKELARDIKHLTTKLYEVEKDYQSKADARRESEEIKRLLKEIKDDVKEVSNKINQKADKSCS